MKTFKQHVNKSNILAEGIYDTVKSGLTSDDMTRRSEALVDYKRNQAGAAMRGVMGDGKTMVGQVGGLLWELIDPTGISSYDDAAEALIHYRKEPTAFNWGIYLLNLFNCIPNIPLIASATATAVGAAGAGVGAVPGAVATGVTALGGVAAKGSVKAAIKFGKKHPEKVIKAVEALTEYSKKYPVVVETLHKLTKEFGGTADEVAKLEKSIGPAPGIKIEGTPSPKGISFDEYKKLSSAEKAKVDAGFAKAATEATTELSKKIKDEPVFKELVDKQKWYRSQEGKSDYGVPDTLKWIVSKSDDKEIAQALDTIAVKNGTTRENVLKAIQDAHPDIKFSAPAPVTPAAAVKGLEDLGKIGAKTSDGIASATKASDEAIDTATDAAKIGDDVAKTGGSKIKDATGVAWQLAKIVVKGKFVVGWEAVQILSRLAANVINPLKQYFDVNSKGGAGAFGAMGAGPGEEVEYTTSDGRKIKTTKQALQDAGLAPLQSPSPTIYTFGGKVLTPAQAAALGTFATPARYNYQTQKWEEVKNVIQPGQQIKDGQIVQQPPVQATQVIPADQDSRFNELGTPTLSGPSTMKPGRIVFQNIPQGATQKNPLGREGMSETEYTKKDKFNNPPTTFEDIFKTVFGP